MTTNSPELPQQSDVDTLRELLDLMAEFRDNDQRARYLLSSNWLRDRGAAAAARMTPRDERDALSPARGTVADVEAVLGRGTAGGGGPVEVRRIDGT
jgi:hypothetical protein